jgi:hypothetical protein
VFDTWFDDIGNEDFISVTEEAVIDVATKSLFSAVLDDSIFVCTVITLVLILGPSLVIGILSVVTSFVLIRMVENVNALFELIPVVSV